MYLKDTGVLTGCNLRDSFKDLLYSVLCLNSESNFICNICLFSLQYFFHFTVVKQYLNFDVNSKMIFLISP